VISRFGKGSVDTCVVLSHESEHAADSTRQIGPNKVICRSGVWGPDNGYYRAECEEKMGKGSGPVEVETYSGRQKSVSKTSPCLAEQFVCDDSSI